MDRSINGKELTPDIIDGGAVALDDERFRRESAEKLVKTVENVGTMMVETAKTSKAMYRYIYIYMGVIIALVLLVVIGYIWSSGSLEKAYQNVFVPLDSNKVINCSFGDESIRFKKTDLESLYYFKQSINASCIIQNTQT